MIMPMLSAVLMLGTWAVVCILIGVLYRIARFYQITSGRRSYYRWFLFPLILLAIGATLNFVLSDTPDLLVDALQLLGGASLIGLGYYLLRLMTGSRS
jgi:hypothetical protein